MPPSPTSPPRAEPAERGASVSPPASTAQPAPSRRLGAWTTLAALLFIAALTLVPTPGAETSYFAAFGCFVCGSFGTIDLLLNIVLFVPLGVGLELLGVRWWRALALVALTTLAVELLQFAVVPGRDASVNDLSTNIVGGALGYGLAAARAGWVWPTPRRAARLAAVWAILWLGGTALTAWALERSLPEPPYFGQWRQERGGAVFDGFIRHVRVNGLSIVRNDYVPWGAPLREALSGPSPRIEASVVAGRPSPHRVPIVVLSALYDKQAFSLMQRGHDLIFRINLRTASARLRTPELVVPDAFPPGAAPRAADIVAGYRAGHLFAAATSGGATRTASLPLTPTLGWSFFLPFDYPLGTPATPWLSALWVAGLLLPLGYWARRAGRERASGRRRALGALAIASVAAAGLGFVPALFATPHVAWSDWLAAALGLAAGWALGALSRRPAAHPIPEFRG